jgi:hypothetical protein
MTSARLFHRAARLVQFRQTLESERCLQRLASEMGINPELLRAEAMALHERFVAAGCISIEEKTAFVADELGVSPDALRRSVELAVACCA